MPGGAGIVSHVLIKIKGQHPGALELQQQAHPPPTPPSPCQHRRAGSQPHFPLRLGRGLRVPRDPAPSPCAPGSFFSRAALASFSSHPPTTQFLEGKLTFIMQFISLLLIQSVCLQGPYSIINVRSHFPFSRASIPELWGQQLTLIMALFAPLLALRVPVCLSSPQ